MQKTELVAEVAEQSGLTRQQAQEAVNAITDQITRAMAQGQSLSLPGFGSFTVRERAARKGRNPQTGAVLEIAASKTVGFKPGKNLREAVN